MSQRYAPWLFGCALVLLCILQTGAQGAVTWDTGYAMDGELADKAIELPVSLESSQTDTMSCGPVDTDSWIDDDQSAPGSGDDPDAWASWASMKCWWWCEGGEVTQGDWTTTWTAPSEGGEYRLECSIEDLPKTCTLGTRDDARAYAGTDYASNSMAASSMGAFGAGHKAPPMRAYKADHLIKNYSVGGNPMIGPLRYPSANFGDPALNDLATPSITNCMGFWKKVEWVAHITPQRQLSKPLGWVQKGIGVAAFDSLVAFSHTSWYPDGPNVGYTTTIDGNGNIYMIDSPGQYTGGLSSPAGAHQAWICEVGDTTVPFRFLNKVTLGGDRISTDYYYENGQSWTRHLYMSKTADGSWVVTYND